MSKIKIQIEGTTEGAVRATDALSESAKKAREEILGIGDAGDAAGKSIKDFIAKARFENVTKRLNAFTAAAERNAAALDKQSKKAKTAAQSMSRFDRATTSIIDKLTIDAPTAFNLLSGGLNTAIGSIDSISKSALATGAVFGNLALRLEPARSATRGLVDDMTLAKLANVALQNKVINNAEGFATLTSAGQKLGARLGIDVTEAVERVVFGLAKQETELLDELGIVLKVSEAQSELAQRLGKTTEELSESEKQGAFAKIGLEKIAEASDGVKFKTEGAAVSVQRLSVNMRNLETQIKGGSQASLSLSEGLNAIALTSKESVVDVRTTGAGIRQLRQELRDAGVASKELVISQTELSERFARARQAAGGGRLTDLILEGKITKDNLELIDTVLAVDKELNNTQRKAIINAREQLLAEDEVADARVNGLKERAASLEDDLAFAQGARIEEQAIADILVEQADVRAQLLELEGKQEEAAKVRRAAELAALRQAGKSVSRVLKKRGRKAKEKTGLDLLFSKDAESFSRRAIKQIERGGAEKKFAAMSREIQDADAALTQLNKTITEDLAEADPLSPQNAERALSNVIDFEERRAQIVLAQRLRQVESLKGQGLDPIGAAREESEAQIRFLNVRLESIDRQKQREIELAILQGQEADVRRLRAEQEMDLAAAQDEIDAQVHGQRILRMEQQREAAAVASAQFKAQIQSGSELVLGFAQNVVSASVMQGKSIRAAVADSAKAEALRHGAILGPSELIQGAISAASFNAPKAAAHFANAGQSFAFAAALAPIAGALGAFDKSPGGGGGDRGGFSGTNFGPGQTSGGRSQAGSGAGAGSAGSGIGPIPLSPEAQSQARAQSGMDLAVGGLTVNQTINVSTLGKPDEDTMRILQQSQDRAARRIGRLSGRVSA